MIRFLLQSAGCFLLCPLLAAQQPPATNANSSAAEVLPDKPSPNSADTESWNHVADLPRGEEIKVDPAHGRTLRCLFAGATSEDLFCASAFTGHEFRFKRADLETVRFNDERRNRNLLIGTLAVAGFGASFVLPRQPGDETPKVLSAFIFGGVGALTGFILSPVVRFLPGRLLYRRASKTQSMTNSTIVPFRPEPQPPPVAALASQ